MTTPKVDPLKPALSLLCKLASIAVHADELLSPKGHVYDRLAFKSAVEDPEVQAWLKEMGPFVPVKR
jgi:hypothetical protein